MSAAPFEIPRPDLVSALESQARSGPPLLLSGPPGAGKTTLLLQAAAALRAAGALPVYLDLFGACSSPDRFVRAALQALPAEGFGARLREAVAIQRLADAGRLHGLEAVQALFDLLASADEASGRPVVLLLDELTEVRSLAYFPGLRQADELLGAALNRRRRGTLLATSFPTLAARSWDFAQLAAGPCAPAAIQDALPPSLRHEGAAVAAFSCGWPRYARILVESLQLHRQAAAPVFVREMAPGGRLELACRHTYEALLLRSRGYGMSKAVLDAVAHEPGLNLTALVARLGRTPGATRDYLLWLVGVDALRVQKKRYYYVDELLRHWVRLFTRGTQPNEGALVEVAGELLSAGAAPVEPATPAEPAEAPTEAPQRTRRPDHLMEID